MFDNESFSHVGGSSPAPRIYTYETTEPRTTVLATGYFNQAYTMKGDGTTSLVVDIYSMNLTFLEV